MDKYSVFEKLVEFHKLKRKQVAYIGYDINDLPVLQSCGLSACPADALGYVKTRVDLITDARGGEGVAREVSDLILAAQGLLDKVLK
jgi:3-deoxy-D-manno-octulosonate 8-phosphate phosphatase (KDO 8-P phosphatase)